MATQSALFSQQSALDRSLPGCWKLGAGRAITLRPEQDGVLRIAHGGMYVTLDGPHGATPADAGDRFLGAGDVLSLQAGQRAVLEPWGMGTQDAAYFTWDPMPAVLGRPVRAAGHWQLSVLQPLDDLRRAAALGAGASGRLVAGLVVFAGEALFGRARALRPAAAFSAQSRACSAHGAIS